MILSASRLWDFFFRLEREGDEDDDEELDDLGEQPRGEDARPRGIASSGAPAAEPADPPKVAVPDVVGILIMPAIRTSCSLTH